MLDGHRPRFGWAPTLILLAAVLVRLPIALFMGGRVGVLPGICDQVSYDALARSLLAE